MESPQTSKVALTEDTLSLRTLERLAARILMFGFCAYDSSNSEPTQSVPCSPLSPSRLSTPPLTLLIDAMDAERLQNIEEGLREQVAANRSTQEMLARLFDKFNNLELPNRTAPQQLITPPYFNRSCSASTQIARKGRSAPELQWRAQRRPVVSHLLPTLHLPFH